LSQQEELSQQVELNSEVELKVEVKLQVEMERQVQVQLRTAGSASQMRSRRFANGRPDAKCCRQNRRILPGNLSARGRHRAARKIVIRIQFGPAARWRRQALPSAHC